MFCMDRKGLIKCFFFCFVEEVVILAYLSKNKQKALEGQTLDNPYHGEIKQLKNIFLT